MRLLFVGCGLWVVGCGFESHQLLRRVFGGANTVGHTALTLIRIIVRAYIETTRINSDVLAKEGQESQIGHFCY